MPLKNSILKELTMMLGIIMFCKLNEWFLNNMLIKCIVIITGLLRNPVSSKKTVIDNTGLRSNPVIKCDNVTNKEYKNISKKNIK